MADDREELLREHRQLSWKIIEAKIMYYWPRGLSEEFIDVHMPTDKEYDALEVRYLKLCVELELENTVVRKGLYPTLDPPGPGMFEVDYSRPSVLNAWEKLAQMDSDYQKARA